MSIKWSETLNLNVASSIFSNTNIYLRHDVHIEANKLNKDSINLEQYLHETNKYKKSENEMDALKVL